MKIGKEARKFICSLSIIIKILLSSKELAATSCSDHSRIQPCPDNWDLTPNPRTCVHHTPLRSNWSDALTVCHEQDSELMVITSAEMNSFIASYIREHGYHAVWLSLTDVATGGRWKWRKITGDEPIHPLVNHWQDGYPVPSKNRHCGVYHPFENGWTNENCEEDHPYLCEKDLPPYDNTCPEGWQLLVTSPMACIKTSPDRTTWEEARKICSDMEASLLSLLKMQTIPGLTFLLSLYHRAWMGLNDREENGKWIWLTGLEHNSEDFSNWGDGHPRLNKREHCSYIREQGDWRIAACQEESAIICQMEARDAPRNAWLHIDYHRPDNILFLDQPFNISCRADDTKYGAIAWTIYKEGVGFLDTSDANISSSRGMEIDHEGRCISQTTYNFTIIAKAFLHGAEISCFASEQTEDRRCRRYSGSLRSCDKSPLIQILDGPRSPPILNTSQQEVPEKGVISVKCSASVGQVGILTWVAYPSTGAEVIYKNNSIVKTYSRQDDNANNTQVVTSSIEFVLRKDQSGMSVACFSYDVQNYKDDLSCLDTNRFCRKSLPFTVIPKPTEKGGFGHFFTFPRVGFFLAVSLFALTLGFIATKIRKVRQNSEDF